MIPIPHVEKTAVVTTQMISLDYNIDRCLQDLQCPGIALRRAMSAILKPPSRTTRARQAYEIFFLSSFSPRDLQQYLNALSKSQSCLYGNAVCGRTRSFLLHQEKCQQRRFQTQPTSPTPAHIILQQFHVRRAKANELRTSKCIMKRVILRGEMI
jgi:hypothetical protein